jgi:hypothetical protein
MKLLVFCVIAFSFIFADGCKTNLTGKKDMKQTISEIETLSGLKFPTGSEIIYNNDNEGRGGSDYLELLIFSPVQIKFSDETYSGGGNEALKLLKDSMPEYDFGSVKSQDSVESIWENKSGKWQAKSIETSKGFYLRLENFK